MNIDVIGKDKQPKLVLIHGWGTSSQIWHPILYKLTKQFQLFLVGLPGHGKSINSNIPLSLESVTNHILSSTPKQAIWISWSLGSLFAMHAAYQKLLTTPLIFISSTPKFIADNHWPFGISIDFFNEFKQRFMDDPIKTLTRFMAMITKDNQQNRKNLQQIKKLLENNKINHQTLMTGLNLLENSNFIKKIKQIKNKMLWINGTQDQLITHKTKNNYFSSLMPGKHISIEEAGHTPFLSHPELVVSTITSFIKTNSDYKI